jgi:hypothetical protein
MNFRVPCPCGAQVTVSEASAGARVSCSCGREVRVPALHELRASIGLPPYPLSPELEIEHMLSRGDVPPRAPCCRCGGETDTLAHAVVRFGERLEPEDDSEEWVFFIGWLPLLFWKGRRSRTFDKEYDLPFHLCPACQPRVHGTRAIRDCLCKVDVYERLLEKHPYAKVTLH